MGDCQHTFCRTCISNWIKNRHSADCPICREKLPKIDKLEKNMLANQLIGDLQIRCANRACSWTGKLDSLKAHLPSCEFREGNLPPWFIDYVRQKEEEQDKADYKDALEQDADVYDLQREDKYVPLAMRLYKTNNSESNQQLKKMIGSKDGRKSDKNDPVVDEVRELMNSFSGPAEEDDLNGN